MNFLLTTAALVFSSLVMANECTQEKAKEVAIKAIEKKFPHMLFESSEYKVIDGKEVWGVYKPVVDPMVFGGGLPEADVSKTNCEVIDVHLSK